MRNVADVLNARFNGEDAGTFPLVLGVMGGAVVFTGSLLPQLSFPLEFDYIHVSRYGDDDKGGEVVWKVIPRSNVAGRTVIVLDDILDEGETLAHVKQRLLDMGASEVILAVFADKNPIPLCSSIEFSGSALPYLREQIKLSETTRIRVVARTSDGKSHVAFREVKVTLGGCGG